MFNNSEIQKKCFVNRGRFIQSARELKKRYPNSRFDQLLRESFEEIIKIAENPDKSGVFRSKNYSDYFTEETGITLENGNPFCIALFSKSLSINIIFLILEECKKWGQLPLLTRGNEGLEESHVVSAFDLFDFSRNESLFRVKKRIC